MKLVVFCLFAVCCTSLARTVPNLTERKLKEVLSHLIDVRKSLQNNGQMLNTPPQNIEDCCCLSALRCFQANLPVQLNVTDSKHGRLLKSLKNEITERGLCVTSKQENDTSTCQDCNSHLRESAGEFLNRLESLVQKAINRLSMK